MAGTSIRTLTPETYLKVTALSEKSTPLLLTSSDTLPAEFAGVVQFTTVLLTNTASTVAVSNLHFSGVPCTKP
jgi:hypothetical protein